MSGIYPISFIPSPLFVGHIPGKVICVGSLVNNRNLYVSGFWSDIDPNWTKAGAAEKNARKDLHLVLTGCDDLFDLLHREQQMSEWRQAHKLEIDFTPHYWNTVRFGMNNEGFDPKKLGRLAGQLNSMKLTWAFRPIKKWLFAHVDAGNLTKIKKHS